MKRILFKINYKVKRKEKFEKFLQLYENEIGIKLKNVQIEKYDKFDGQFQANFYIEINSTKAEEIVYEILIFANTLWSSGNFNWKFNGPYENEDLAFECILNNNKDDQPIKWAQIELE